MRGPFRTLIVCLAASFAFAALSPAPSYAKKRTAAQERCEQSCDRAWALCHHRVQRGELPGVTERGCANSWDGCIAGCRPR